MNSFRFFAGTDGFRTSTNCVVTMPATGVKSLIRSKGRFGIKWGTVVCVDAANEIV